MEERLPQGSEGSFEPSPEPIRQGRGTRTGSHPDVVVGPCSLRPDSQRPNPRKHAAIESRPASRPASPPDALQQASHPAPPPGARCSPREGTLQRDHWILLVEDNEDDILLMRRALDRQGVPVRVVVARDGAEALHILRHGPPAAERDPGHGLERLPELVLLDINLPKLSGLDVLERIRDDALTRLLRVVMLSTSDLEQDLSRSYAAGASSFVRKPVDFGEFQEAVRSIGRYWLGLNEPLPMAG